jgi:hypothetical protein
MSMEIFDGSDSVASAPLVTIEGVIAPLSASTAAASQIESWSTVCFSADVSGWTDVECREGIRALESAKRSLVAMTSALVIQLRAGRDTVASLTRATGMSGADARQQRKIADVIDTSPGVGDLLAAGQIGAGHVAALAGATVEVINELLPHATTQTVDEFRRTVQKARVDTEPDLPAKQRASRRLSFFTSDNGCIGFRGVLPPVEGAEFKTLIQQISNDAYRAEHPDRAKTSGGHRVEAFEQRFADAFVKLFRGQVGTGGRPSIVVTVNAETLDTEVVPSQPISKSELVEMIVRADLFAMIREHTNGAVLRFGRNRRLASPLQKLLLSTLQHGCVINGCDQPPNKCETHHLIEYDDGGCTDIEQLVLLCSAHHHWLHDNRLLIHQTTTGKYLVRPKPPNYETKAA